MGKISTPPLLLYCRCFYYRCSAGAAFDAAVAVAAGVVAAAVNVAAAVLPLLLSLLLLLSVYMQMYSRQRPSVRAAVGVSGCTTKTGVARDETS